MNKEVGSVEFSKKTRGVFSMLQVTSLLAVFGAIMLTGGLYMVVANTALPLSADTARATSVFAMQLVDEVLGFPLPTNQMVNESLSAIGVSSFLVGLDLLMIFMGIRAKSKFALWIGIVTLTLATFFDFIAFLYQGVIGAPMSVPGVVINGLAAYILLRNRSI